MALKQINIKFVKRLAVSLTVFFLLAAILNTGKLFEVVYPSFIKTLKTEDVAKINWSSTSILDPGEYFLSIGRAQGSCKVFQNNILIGTNEGTSVSGRSSLYLGSKIVIAERGPQTFNLICDKSSGSHVRLIHEPYLNRYRQGILLHTVRIFTDIFLPMLAIILVIFLVCFSVKEPLFLLPKAGVITAFFTVLYLISLMNLQYLFVSNLASAYIHSVLKVGFVFSVLAWLCSFKKLSHALTIAGLTIAAIFTLLYKFSPEQLLTIYTIFVKWVPCVAVTTFCVSMFSEENTPNQKLTFAIIPFSVFSVLDYLTWQSTSGIYLSTATTFSVFGLAAFSYLKSEKARSVSRKAISIIASKQLERSSTTESLSQITMILSECLKLSDWSIYIDSYNLGSAPKPGRELRRLASSSNDNKFGTGIMLFEDTHSEARLMKEAVSSNKPIVTELKNGRICAVIPIGNDCCINLGDLKKSKLGEEFIKTFIEEAYQQINALALTIIKFESTASFSVTLLKEELGIGTHELEFGAIFADAVGYTQNVKSSKNFIEFFEREYVPCLLRNLERKVILKDLFGDELYLVVLPKSMTAETDKNIYATTMEIVQRLEDFSFSKGAELCISAGYKPIEFRIGANAGKGQIVITHSNAALSGPVIEAKRCQGRAQASQPFVTEVLIENSEDSIRINSTKETYAAKKEILVGYKVNLKNKAA